MVSGPQVEFAPPVTWHTRLGDTRICIGGLRRAGVDGAKQEECDCLKWILVETGRKQIGFANKIFGFRNVVNNNEL